MSSVYQALEGFLVAGVDELVTEKFSLSLIEKFHEMSQKKPEMDWTKFNSLVEKSKMWKRAQHAKSSFALSQLEESLLDDDLKTSL